MDFSDKWNDRTWTSGRCAFLPMRMQPTHRGHINLILNTLLRFRKAHVLIDPRTDLPDNPFGIQDREGWLQAAMSAVRADSSKLTITPALDSSTRPSTEDHRSHRVRSCNDIPYAVVSGNRAVVQSCLSIGEPVLQVAIVDSMCELPPELAVNLDNNARILRACLRNDSFFPSDYLPLGLQCESYREAYRQALRGNQ